MLEGEGVLVVRHHFSPLRVDPTSKESQLSVYQPDNGLHPVSTLLPLVHALPDVWMNDIQVHAFARSDSRLSAQDVIDRLPPYKQGG